MKNLKLLPAIVAIYVVSIGGGLGLFYLTKDIESIPRAVQDTVPFLFQTAP